MWDRSEALGFCMQAIVLVLLSWQIVARAETGSMPWGVTVSADGADVYVTHVGQKDRDNARRYDAATLEVEAVARFKGHAVESALDGATLWVTNSRKHVLLGLDAATLAVTASWKTGRIPKDFRLAGGRAYVADYGSRSLSIVDLATGDRTAVKVGRSPRGVALSADGATAYVTNMGSGTVSVVDTAAAKVTTTWKACRSPRHAVVAGDRLLVSCYGARHVVVLDAATGKKLRTVAVGRGPKTIALTPDGATAFVANERADSITVIDLASYETSTVSDVGDQPCGVTVSPDGARVYVTARGSDELVVLGDER
jgi:YVTN family beta-propeller protein